MSESWIYDYGDAISGNYEHGYPEMWAWAKNKGNYNDGRDFFRMHWEVQVPKYAHAIRLHVESPRYIEDASLNDLKRELVAALLASDAARIVQEKGYEYKPVRRTSDAQIRQNKCTEAFRIVLNDGQRNATHEEDIKAVHAAVGTAVEEVLQRFSDRLNRQFYA